MARTPFPTRRPPWALGLLVLLLTAACRRDDGVPSWQADALVPLVRDQLGIRDLVADSLLEIDPDGALRLVYADRLLRVDLIDEGIAIPDTGLTVSVSLETLVLEDRSITTAISLGRILQACGLERSACLLLEDPPGGAFADWQRRFDFPLLVAFGRRPEHLGLQLRPGRDGRARLRGVEFVFGPSLDRLAADPAAKKALWTALQDALAKARPPASGRTEKPA